MKLITKTVVLLFVFMAFIACSPRQSQQAANSEYDLELETMSTAVGETMLMVTLTDSEGNPVNDATLEVKGDMSHAGMQPVLAEASSGEAGVYSVPFEWTMGGDWIVTVDATLADGTTVSEQFDGISVSGEGMDMDMEDMDMEDMEMEEGEMDMEMEEGEMDMDMEDEG